MQRLIARGKLIPASRSLSLSLNLRAPKVRANKLLLSQRKKAGEPADWAYRLKTDTLNGRKRYFQFRGGRQWPNLLPLSLSLYLLARSRQPDKRVLWFRAFDWSHAGHTHTHTEVCGRGRAKGYGRASSLNIHARRERERRVAGEEERRSSSCPRTKSDLFWTDTDVNLCLSVPPPLGRWLHTSPVTWRPRALFEPVLYYCAAAVWHTFLLLRSQCARLLLAR